MRSEIFNFHRHHREPTPKLAGAGGFDRRVERHHAGAFGDGLDRGDKRGDLARLFRQPRQPAAGLIDGGEGFLKSVRDALGLVVDVRFAKIG